ncbi:MAG: hypothetical protein J6M56_00985 [Clostridia bacterium]|nr:hypothetical protein [Clostridia bacterium]
MSEEHSTREDSSVFTYTYSARQQEEIRSIQRKYLPHEEDKMEQLRRLDRSVTRKGTRAALALGIAGTLVLGTGMSMTMVLADIWFVPGIAVGVLGLACMGLSYPLYVRVTKRERERAAPEILRLSSELLR